MVSSSPSKSRNGQEMVQIENSEFVFGENGGRGLPLRALLRSSSNAPSNSKLDDDSDNESRIVGASYSFADWARTGMLSKHSSGYSSRRQSMEKSEKSIAHSNSSLGNSYDDEYDWNPNLDDDDNEARRIKSIENVPDKEKRKKGKGKSTKYHRNSFNYMTNIGPISSNLSEGSSDQTQGNGNSNGNKMTDNNINDNNDNNNNNSNNNNNNNNNNTDTLNLDTQRRRASQLTEASSFAELESINARLSRINRFKKLLDAKNVDIIALKKLAWSGIPDELRAMTWKLLLGYLPTNSDRRSVTLARKRKEYTDGVIQTFSRKRDQTMWHQIIIDVPRTNPHIKLYGFEATHRSLERILYLWASRHPASGYVQGINDLVTPFFQVFLSSCLENNENVNDYDPSNISKEIMDQVEADSFWCLTKLLDGIQDNYIQAQPGIQRQVSALKDLTKRIDVNLAKHLQNEGVDFIQFSFRWMNCMLMRELSINNVIRMWDTYLAEDPTGFSQFHVYVCAAFLVKWSAQIQTMDFQEIMMFLQSLPTKDWTDKDIELLLSEAYMWQSLFKNASAHLRQGVNSE